MANNNVPSREILNRLLKQASSPAQLQKIIQEQPITVIPHVPTSGSPIDRLTFNWYKFIYNNLDPQYFNPLNPETRNSAGDPRAAALAVMGINSTSLSNAISHVKNQLPDHPESKPALEKLNSLYQLVKDWETDPTDPEGTRDIPLAHRLKAANELTPLPLTEQLEPVIPPALKISLNQDGNLPELAQASPQPQEGNLYSPLETYAQAAHVIPPPNVEPYYQQQTSQLQRLLSQPNFQISPNQLGQFFTAPRRTLNRFTNTINNLKTTSKILKQSGLRGLSSNLKRRVVASIGKRIGIEAGKAGLKAVLSGGTSLAVDAIGLLRHQKVRDTIRNSLLTAGTLSMLFIKSLIPTWASGLAGAVSGISTFIATGGNVAAAAGGAYLGSQATSALQSYFGGTAQAAAHVINTPITGSTTTRFANLNTGQLTTVSTRTNGLLQVITEATVTNSFTLLVTTAPFFLGLVLSIIVAMNLLVAFTVPNPQTPTFGPFGFNNTPGGNTAPSIPGTPGTPGTPGGTGTTPSDGAENCYNFTNQTKLQYEIDTAAQAACIPSAFLTAIIAVEAPGTLDYTDDSTGPSFDFFNTESWWTTANNGGNCYDDTASPPNASDTCWTGYCVNTCAKLYNGKNLCLPLDVRGSAQFLSTTFYGDACVPPDALNANGTRAPYCGTNAGTPAHYISTKIRNNPAYVPDRCRVSDALYAAAFKVARDSGQVSFNSSNGYSCSYDPGVWASEAAKEAICKAARSYCGSCGTIEAEPRTGQPCEEWYLKPGDRGYASGNCGQPGTLGHCNMVYNNYVENLSCIQQ